MLINFSRFFIAFILILVLPSTLHAWIKLWEHTNNNGECLEILGPGQTNSDCARYVNQTENIVNTWNDKVSSIECTSTSPDIPGPIILFDDVATFSDPDIGLQFGGKYLEIDTMNCNSILNLHDIDFGDETSCRISRTQRLASHVL